MYCMNGDLEANRSYILCPSRSGSEDSMRSASDRSDTSTFDGSSVEEKQNDIERASRFSISSVGSRELRVDLPPQNGFRAYRWLRWTLFSTYRRIFTVAFLANTSVLITLLVRTFKSCEGGLTLSNTLTATSVNLAISLLSRNEHLINLLFAISTSIPPDAPLWARKMVAKIYAYGGIHSGCAMAAILWYIGFGALIVYRTIKPPFANPAIVAITGANVALLLIITAFSHPFLRRRLHDWFEATHRFAGWTATVLFWAQTFITASINCRTQPERQKTLGQELMSIPTFWCLILITLCVIYPWTLLRKHKVMAEPLSTHAVRLHFSYTDVSYCETIRLATNPLLENHAFAAIARDDSPCSTSQLATCEPEASSHSSRERGFSVLVSNAGDWTSSIIANPPKSIYVRGTPTYGVLRVAVLFSPVLIVATGSGIGPCLSLFRGRPQLNCRVIWSTPSPVETYGTDVVRRVREADPQACIFDTRKCGRPDLLELAWSMWKRLGCEAVVLISNQTVTRRVIYGLETRGVPAFAPIFDS